VFFLESSVVKQASLVLSSVNGDLAFVAFNFVNLTLEVMNLLFEVVALLLECSNLDIIVVIISGSMLVPEFVGMDFLLRVLELL
jgi:hypothetical protein